MQCPTCGYLMQPADLDCPRCKVMSMKATVQGAGSSVVKQTPLNSGETWEERTAKRTDHERTALSWLLRGIIGLGVLFILFIVFVILFKS